MRARPKPSQRGGIPTLGRVGTPPPRGVPRSGPQSFDLSLSWAHNSFVEFDYRRARQQMVRDLRRMGIRDERVLAAMERVPRHRFVRPEDVDVAYGDHALPLGEGQ